MNFEEVDNHLDATLPALIDANAMQASSKTEKLKKTWATVRPILALVVMLPIIPRKWKIALNILIQDLDILTANKQADENS